MPNSAAATAVDDNKNIPPYASPRTSAHWLSDPQQLASWQIQLVDCCHAINLQLNQIQDGLAATVNPVRSETSLRIVGAADTGTDRS